MANAKQLAEAKKGARAWNAWRTTTAEPIDLSGADLRRANLCSLDLSGANLDGANLGEANLVNAYLRNASLRDAELPLAILIGAKLINADLSGANLTGTNLTGANLDGANLSNATLSITVFSDTYLANTIGLETCRHAGPSILDPSTMEKNGRLPVSFLRGCGFPENLIEYLNQPIELYSCFISYSTKDQPFADRIYADLQNAGVRCWFAPHDMVPGKKVHHQIDEAIHFHDKLLLILSEHSMTSEWVKTEIAEARKKELEQRRPVLFPIRLVPFKAIKTWTSFDPDTGKDSAKEIREYFIPDFSTWKTNHDAYEAAFDSLVRSLQPKESTTTAKA